MSGREVESADIFAVEVHGNIMIEVMMGRAS
jgi:hypothetical protein